MLRAVLVLLLALNAAFFAWTQGWLPFLGPPPSMSQREPERMAAQVAPEKLQLLAGPAASAALAAAVPQCLEAGPLPSPEAYASLEAALLQAGVAAERWQRREAALPTGSAASGSGSSAASAPAPASAASAPTGLWLRLPRTDAGLREQLQKIRVEGFALTFVPCAS